MSQKPDDLDAVRIIVDALKPFDDGEKDRIIRWASEKLGLKSIGTFPPPNIAQSLITPITQSQVNPGTKDIKTFLQEKNPSSANQLIAAVAYYYKFEAPPTEKKNAIAKEDLVEACRKAARKRPKYPNQELVNASAYGLIDKVGTGAYEINAVGENLVISLPGTAHGNSGVQRSTTKSKKAAKKKK